MIGSTKAGSPRVVDFSTHFSGPLASRQLVQLGADVVKIEAPVYGDGNRGTPPLVDGEGAMHAVMNAGTRSIVADTKSEGWADLVAAAARWADVVIVGSRPSAAARRGIDFASIRRHRPDIVYCQITGFGVAGPWADYPAHGLQMDALAGVVPVQWDDAGQPVPDASFRSIGTSLAGIQAAVGIYAGLFRRSQQGGAQYVHVSLWESALSWMWRDVATFTATGEPWRVYSEFGPRYRMYRTADNRAILVCPIERHFWQRFCDAIDMAEARDRGDWSLGTEYGSNEGGESAAIAERIARKSLAEWEAILRAVDVPFAPILDWREAVSSEHGGANGVLADFSYRGRTTRVPTIPVSLVETPADAATPSLDDLAEAHRQKGQHLTPPPQLGEHTDEVLADFGVSDLADRLHRK